MEVIGSWKGQPIAIVLIMILEKLFIYLEISCIYTMYYDLYFPTVSLQCHPEHVNLSPSQLHAPLIIIIINNILLFTLFPVSVDHVQMGMGSFIGQPTGSHNPKESVFSSISNHQLSIAPQLLVGSLGPCPHLCWEFLLT